MSKFRYDSLVQKALISVVKEVLSDVSENGLSGNHHFYIRFRTDHPRTIVPSFLKEQYPEEIMIVLQYQFWNLKVDDHFFSVELSFDGIREVLRIPFDALCAFVDPSVKFALQFTPKFDPSVKDTPPVDDDPNGGNKTKKTDSSSKSEDNIISFDSLKNKK
ncbi:MAG: hypothetical protein E7015_00180 [Alphaproteobacteria bacterium]|nr:hypothetical protein [Alphaproteobacteria bacterium]